MRVGVRYGFYAHVQLYGTQLNPCPICGLSFEDTKASIELVTREVLPGLKKLKGDAVVVTTAELDAAGV